MKRIDFRILIGAILISTGVLFFLQTLNILSNVWSILWIVVFFAGSGIFFYVYLTDRRQWWALIPATTFLGLAGTIIMDTYFPEKLNLGGVLILGGIGLGFLIIYLTNRDFWWAIIPGGVLATVAVFVLLENVWAGFGGPGVFFVGLGLTFFLLYIVPTPEGRMTWAWIPGAVLTVIGFIIIVVTEQVITLLWPLALILLGLILIVRFFISR